MNLKQRKLKIILALSIVILMLWGGTTNAADIITWDGNYSRDRSTSDTLFPYYGDPSIHVSLGDAATANLDSYSTPITYGNTLYMFAWDGNSWVGDTLTTGQLIAVDISHPNPTSTTDFPIRWRLYITLDSDGSQGSIYGVPGPSISQDGQYISIAVGNYLYSWPMSENPADGSGGNPLSTATIPDLQYYRIIGNAGQTPNEIAMTPAVTAQSSTWTGVDSSYNTIKWQAPVAACGSWNGGFTAAPLFAPSGVQPIPLKMSSTQLDADSRSAAFTSSPIVRNDGDIVWGIDPNGGRATLQLYVLHPGMMQDVIHGIQPMQYTFGDFIGTGKITNPMPSAPAYDRVTGDIYVQDTYGYIYQFDPSGHVMHVCGTTSKGNSYLGSVNLAIDGSCVYAAESDGSSIDALDKSNLHDWGSIFPAAVGHRNPSVVVDPASGKRIVIANDVNGVNHLEQVSGGSGVTATAKDFNTGSLTGDPIGNNFSSVIVDAGPQQEIIAWSPATAQGSSYSGELVIWPQSVPNLTTFVSPGSVQSGASATVVAQTTISHTISTVYAQLPNSDGTLQATATPMTFSGVSQGANDSTIYTWVLPFTAPINNTSATITATIPVQLNYNNPSDGSPLTSNASYYVNPEPPQIQSPPTNSNQLSVTSYAAPINKTKVFQPWPVAQLTKAHPSGQTYMGDTILCNVTSDVPPPPQGTIDNAYIVPGSAMLTHPQGYAPASGEWQVKTVSDTMNITSSLKATLQCEEDFDGWSPGNYTNSPDSGSLGSLELNTPGTSYPISASWTLHEDYHWTEVVCVGSGKSVVCSPITHHGQIDYPMNDSKSVTVMGTDFVVIPIVAGNIYGS